MGSYGSVVTESCGLWFFGNHLMVEVLKQAGMWHVSSEDLKMSVNTGDSASGWRVVF